MMTTQPQRETLVVNQEQQKVLPLRLYLVRLWNDDHNEMRFVVACLQKIFSGYSRQKCGQLMMEAHNTGSVCCIKNIFLEQAELYRDQLLSFGLTASIEQV